MESNGTFQMANYFCDGQLLRIPKRRNNSTAGLTGRYSSMLNAIVWVKEIHFYGFYSDISCLKKSPYDNGNSYRHYLYFKSETVQDFCIGKGVPLDKYWYKKMLDDIKIKPMGYGGYCNGSNEMLLSKLIFKDYYDNPDVKDVGFNTCYTDMNEWKSAEWFDGKEWNSVVDIENQEIILLKREEINPVELLKTFIMTKIMETNPLFSLNINW